MNIFISYGRQDKAFAIKLAQDLEQLGLDIWLDVEDIPAGMKWSSAIQQGLDSTQVMILIISPDSMASTNVEDEWQYYLDEQKPVIPVLLEPAKIHFQIRRLQHIDFHLQDYQTGFEKLCAELEAKLGSEVSPGEANSRNLLHAKQPSSNSLMPPPFAWIDIPAGKVKLEAGGYVPLGGQTFDVTAFTIAKYPVTNAQFSKFIEAKGYEQLQWWTIEGWQAKLKNAWTQPRSWQYSDWNQRDQPVIGVSWFDALAFCSWLSEQVDEKITLPTEQQWQHAAQGDTNRHYPWGDQFDQANCNFHTKWTTPVTKYEDKGDSPYQVVDMCGNVWEWCLTSYENGTQNIDQSVKYRVLRGGSWNDTDQSDLHVTSRNRYFPDAYNRWSGFRIVRLK